MDRDQSDFSISPIKHYDDSQTMHRRRFVLFRVQRLWQYYARSV